MSNKKYKNIIFDLGAVLVNWRPQEFLKDFKRKYSIISDKDAWLEIFKSSRFQELDRGISTRMDVVNAFSKKYEKDFLLHIFENFKEHVFILKKGLDILNMVKDRGFKTYILSNFSKEGFEEVFPKLTFLDKFDGAILSYQVKLIKPELEIYKTLLDTYSLKAKECLFIDDMPENISAGISCGIDGIVCKNHVFVKKELKRLEII